MHGSSFRDSESPNEINGLEIEAEWADVPRGDPYGTGTLSLIVVDDGTGNLEIRKEGETGTGFENTTWTPCKAA